MKTCKECGAEVSTGARCDPAHQQVHAVKSRAYRARQRKDRFPGSVRRSLLRALATGVPFGEACHERGVSAQLVWGTAHAEPRFAQQLDAALMAGRSPDIPHGRTWSYRRGCRCPECRRAHEAARH